MLTSPWATQIKNLHELPRIMADDTSFRQMRPTVQKGTFIPLVVCTRVYINAGPKGKPTLAKCHCFSFTTASRDALEQLAWDQINNWIIQIDGFGQPWADLTMPTGPPPYKTNSKELG